MKNSCKSLLALIICVSVIVGCSDNEKVALNKCFPSTYSFEDGSFTFKYGSDNKLTEAVASFKIDGVTVSQTSTLTYDSKGNISKISTSDGYASYTYNSNNLLIKEESYDGTELDELTEYEYNSSGQLIKRQYYYINSSGNSVKSNYSIFTYSSTSTKNPAKEQEYSPSGTLYGTYEYTFDDKKAWFSEIGLGATFGDIAAEENNITKVVYKDDDGSVSTTTTSVYEYNEKGYPTKVTSTEVSVGGSEVSTLTYTYNCK